MSNWPTRKLDWIVQVNKQMAEFGLWDPHEFVHLHVLVVVSYRISLVSSMHWTDAEHQCRFLVSTCTWNVSCQLFIWERKNIHNFAGSLSGKSVRAPPTQHLNAFLTFTNAYRVWFIMKNVIIIDRDAFGDSHVQMYSVHGRKQKLPKLHGINTIRMTSNFDFPLCVCVNVWSNGMRLQQSNSFS